MLYKLILLFSNKEKLATFLSKNRAYNTVIDSLMLLSGIIALFFSPALKESWFIVKIILFMILLPLAIIGFKKQKPLLVVISFIGFVYLYGISETKSPVFRSARSMLKKQIQQDIEVSDPIAEAKKISPLPCQRCHGEDGNMGVYGAKKLSESKLSDAEKMKLISEGKGVMPNYSFMPEENVKAVVDYVNTLK